MSRHQQRDQEAGGPGCGTLDTRKRAWKGPDGSVVEKRPRVSAPDSDSGSGSASAPGASASAQWDSSAGPDQAQSVQVVSPPVSDEGSLGRYAHTYNFNDDDGGSGSGGVGSALIDPFDTNPLPGRVTPSSLPRFDDYLSQASLPTRPSPSHSHGQQTLEYQPVFQPDTASSFNMPYTTALDYNWLFNIEAATASGFGLISSGPTFQDQSFLRDPESSSPLQIQSDNMAPSSQQVPQNLTPESLNSAGWQASTEQILDQQSPRATAAARASSSPWNDAPDGRRRQQQQPQPSSHARNSSISTVSSQAPRPRRNRAVEDFTNHDVLSMRRYQDAPSEGGAMDAIIFPPINPEKPLSMLQSNVQLPQIDETTWQRLLLVIENANPAIPDQPPGVSVRDHPLLAPQSLQSWLDLFFTQFNTTYPLMHMPTFSPAHTEPLLLLSMVLLGATYSDKGAHQIAVCVHDVIRPSIFAHAGFSPTPELWTLQTILLVECFGKSRAGQKQHDFSHLFHGLLINLIRRSDCQSVTSVPTPPPEGSDPILLDQTWRRWADAEQKKRLALLCFMWDVQHAVLFCQSLCMSAFELRCAMPCSQSIWEASDPACWATTWRRTFSSSSSTAPSQSKQPTLFLPTLKAYLSPNTAAETRTHGLNALSIVFVLHGIMSIAWDMQRRDQTSLGVNSMTGRSGWRGLLGDAYDRWQVDFDQYCANAANASDAAAEWHAFAAAYRAVYQAAQALLHMDFLDVQIYAGARHILGRPVQQQDYLRSSRVVKKWASGDRTRAATAALHAARMLSDVTTSKTMSAPPSSFGLGGRDTAGVMSATETNLFHVPWCLYLATLTCWAFHHAMRRPARGGSKAVSRYDDGGDGEREGSSSLMGDVAEDEDSDESDDEIVWDAQKEMESLVRVMAGGGGSSGDAALRDVLAVQGRKGTNGLIWVVADLLSKVRWGIVHAGVVVLRGLVPGRLINQYETTY